jgi:hypothetical protein
MMRTAFADIPEITEDNGVCAANRKRLLQAR